MHFLYLYLFISTMQIVSTNSYTMQMNHPSQDSVVQYEKFNVQHKLTVANLVYQTEAKNII